MCERIRSTKSFVERKQKRVEQAQEALNLAMASQEEEKLLAEGERRLAELMMEEKTLPSPFQANPVCNVNAELDHLRAEISRLRQQQDGMHNAKNWNFG